MVNAMINISDRANRVLNIIKARYGFKDKSQAIEKMAEDYEDYVLEPGFKPEFAASVKHAQQQGKFRKVKKITDITE